MRGEEIRQGIDVFPTLSEEENAQKEKEGSQVQSLGKSKKAATPAVGGTALSRVLNSTPITVLPPLVPSGVAADRVAETKTQDDATCESRCAVLLTQPATPLLIMTNTEIDLILTTSIFALPLALAAFLQRQAVLTTSLEEQF